MASALERSFRRTIDAGFHQAVSFGTLSILGSLVALPLVTVGPAIFGVAHAIATVTRRGSQHGVGETTSLFVEGVRRYVREGLALSAVVLGIGAIVVANGVAVLGGPSTVTVALLAPSFLLTVSVALVAMHAVGLIACGFRSRSAIRDGAVLLFKRPGATVLQGVVVGSLFVLGMVTMIGWLLIGFAVAVSFSLRATDGLYETDDGRSPLHS